MQYYLAPMEGLTTYVFRQAFHKHYGGCDQYFAPFISDHHFNLKEKRELLPENNAGYRLIPQILTNNAEEFLLICRNLKEYGYDTVNLNLGCPSGTVTAKHRGAGLLAVPEELDAFLCTIFEKSPLPISIKTRLGYTSLEEWPKLLEIYSQYPITELIIHTRLAKEFYKGHTHPEAFLQAVQKLHVPLCYNGDITSIEDLAAVQTVIPQPDRVMIGRGILSHPDLFLRLKGNEQLNHAALRAFHDAIYEGYRQWGGGAMPTLFKMKELWCYLSVNFPDQEKIFKKIKKASHFSEYEAAVDTLFQSQC